MVARWRRRRLGRARGRGLLPTTVTRAPTVAPDRLAHARTHARTHAPTHRFGAGQPRGRDRRGRSSSSSSSSGSCRRLPGAPPRGAVPSASPGVVRADSGGAGARRCQDR